jgi:transposase
MSSQRFAPEFEDEAVRQIVERGHPVSEVAQRLGVSAHSLYKCAVLPRNEYSNQDSCAAPSIAASLALRSTLIANFSQP